jgi:hypothetical protein
MPVPRRDNWVGHSYIRVLSDGFNLKAIDFTVCEHEYMKYTPPPPKLRPWKFFLILHVLDYLGLDRNLVETRTLEVYY